MPTGRPEPIQPVIKPTDNTDKRKNVIQVPSTPFKTQAEGDAFRTWVRQTDATYASQIKLDATGPFNNNTIRTAYQKYGNQYQQSLTSGGGVQTPSTTVDKEKVLFDEYNNDIFFYSVNN
jgi:hypothetical protein